MHLNARLLVILCSVRNTNIVLRFIFILLQNLGVILSFIMEGFDVFGTIYLVIGLQETVDGGHQ